MIREKWNADWKFKKGGPSLMGSLMGGERRQHRCAASP